MGCAAAYYLAKGGVDVAVLERASVNREASGANAGSLHLQIYIHPHFPDDWIERIRPSIALMREAAKGWATMESELETDCGIRLGGGLWVAETPDEMRLIEKKVAAERSMGVESRVLSRDEILAVAPYLGPHVIGGSFLEGEGFANPLLVTPAHNKAAARHGARFFADAPARAITRESDGGFVDRDRTRRLSRAPNHLRRWSLDSRAWTHGRTENPCHRVRRTSHRDRGPTADHARPSPPACRQGLDP